MEEGGHTLLIKHNIIEYNFYILCTSYVTTVITGLYTCTLLSIPPFPTPYKTLVGHAVHTMSTLEIECKSVVSADVISEIAKRLQTMKL